jgi:zinc protease
MRRLRPGLLLVLACLPGVAAAALDLKLATMDRLDNGLELIVLEEHSLPVVSVQMLYRTGARDEEYGRTGLAHYLEHMAFRATENFPGTKVTTQISGVGGEWHGYTWIDQTTYFETLPKDQLDLALRIEADRLGHLLIPEKEVEAERGAVLAELHGYENDPATVLNDAVVYTSLLAHPYRNNTIGWESDVKAIQRSDLVAFYREHYKAANAVLVVVGDVDTKAVRKRVTELFGKYPPSEPTPLPATSEPPQLGDRRVDLEGAGGASYFEIVYRAPAAGSPDFPAFVLMQELLGGGDGVNFDQGLGGASVRDGALLKGVAADMETWLPPAAQPYIFTISGSVPAGASTKEIEGEIEARVAILRDEATSEKRMAVARERMHAELVFDVETTEDAAHQLAFYAGLNALGPFLALPDGIDATTAEQVQDIAVRYLQPHQRTIGWYHAGKPLAVAQIAPAPAQDTIAESPPPAPETVKATPPSPPVIAPLRNGVTAIVQRMPLSRAAYVRVLVPAGAVEIGSGASADPLAWDVTSIGVRSTSAEIGNAVGTAAAAVAGAKAGTPEAADGVTDPESRLELTFQELLGMEPPKKAPELGPALVVAVGDLDIGKTLNLLESSIGQMKASAPARTTKLKVRKEKAQDVLRVRLEHPIAQAQLGYVVPAPSPSSKEAMTWRLLLYVLSHGYEGRLGQEAISKRGLVYYIDSRYRSDGDRAFVSLAMGVDPAKVEPMEQLLRVQLAQLQSSPPTEDELAEAKRNLLGRLQTAAESNEEISAKLALEWLWYGRLLEAGEVEKMLAEITTRDLAKAAPAFTSGVFALVSN